jgi:hypothetical protein
MILSGVATQSTAIPNGSFGIFATEILNSTAFESVGDGLIADAGGGVVMGSTSSFNTGRVIVLPNGTATGNTVTLNKGVGISSVCPSTIVTNTIVANGGIIETERDGCVLANNSSR